mmetsp:Transcript_1068/g.1691  ORF Transcript_1068/g.1691 Transcript_1068/m.1691 type:complete len:92 (-) Transcript_1068:582-857(-)
MHQSQSSPFHYSTNNNPQRRSRPVAGAPSSNSPSKKKNFFSATHLSLTSSQPFQHQEWGEFQHDANFGKHHPHHQTRGTYYGRIKHFFHVR